MSAAGGAAAGAAAAAEQRRLQQEEEEGMTDYRPDELEGWEFKILRSATGSFKKPEKLREALEQEARAGWVLVEKFDDNRVRLKRSTDRRSQDSMLDFDPYRTWTGTTPNAMALTILGIIFGLLALGGVAVTILANM